MQSCKEIARLIASEELVDAGWLRRTSVRLHLLSCRHCRGYAAQVRAIGAAARDRWGSGPDEQALERLERSILERCLDASDVNAEDRRGGDSEPPAETDPH